MANDLDELLKKGDKDNLVTNWEKDRIKSNIGIVDFAKAMQQMDRTGIPKDKMAQATIDHLMRVIADNISDKEKADEIMWSRVLYAKEGS
tara:strand:- start:1947 stop:2216 length:270 start_codon:yes stop_codon:yes gene_type:complete